MTTTGPTPRLRARDHEERDQTSCDTRGERLLTALDDIECEIEYREADALRGPGLAMLPPKKSEARLGALRTRRGLLQARLAKLPEPVADEPTYDEGAVSAALDEAEALLDAKKYDEARAVLRPQILSRRRSPEITARGWALWRRLPKPGGPHEVLTEKIDRVLEAQRDVLRFSDAVARLPMRDSVARVWLRREGLVGDLDGREIVVWPEVVERLRQRSERRVRNRRSVPKAPTSLPRASMD